MCMKWSVYARCESVVCGGRTFAQRDGSGEPEELVSGQGELDLKEPAEAVSSHAPNGGFHMFSAPLGGLPKATAYGRG